MLNSSFKILSPNICSRLKESHPLRVKYVSSIGPQYGQDDGGLCRDWFSRLSQELVLPSGQLFQPQEGNFVGKYQFKTFAHQKSDHYRLLGRLIGLSIILDLPLFIDFVPSIYKGLIGEELILHDLSFVDDSFFRFVFSFFSFFSAFLFSYFSFSQNFSSFQHLDTIVNDENQFKQATQSMTFSLTLKSGEEFELR